MSTPAANAFDDIPTVVPGLTDQPANAFDDIKPPEPKPKDKADERPPSLASQVVHMGGMAGRVLTNAVTALPFMAMDAGVGARNLFGKLTGIGGTDYEYPSQTLRQAEDQYFGKPQNALEKLEDITGPMAVGGASAALRVVPGASPVTNTLAEGLRNTAGATPVTGTALGGAAGPAADFSAMTPAQLKAMRIAQTLKESQSAGYVVPPATSNPTLKNVALETVAGKIATQQQAALANSHVTNELAAQELGLNPDVPITVNALAELRRQAGTAYEAMRNLGQVAPDQTLRDNLLAIREKLTNVEHDFPGSKPSPVKAEIDSILGTKEAPAVPRSPRAAPLPPPAIAPPGAAPVAAPRPGPRGSVVLDQVTLNPQRLADGLGSLGNAAEPRGMPPPAPGPGPVNSNVPVDPLLLPKQPPPPDFIAGAGNGAKGPSSSAGAAASDVRLDPLTLNPQTRTFSASSMVTKIRNLRDAADVAARAGDKGTAATYKAVADNLEAQIDRTAQARISAGDTSVDPNVVANFRSARQTIAKTYTVENALNEATGNVSATKLANSGDPLTGRLATAARFAAAFPKAAQDAEKIGSAGVNHLGTYGALGIGGLAEHMTGSPYALAAGAALPIARAGAKAYLLGPGQVGAIPKVVGPGSPKSAAAIAQALKSFSP